MLILAYVDGLCRRAMHSQKCVNIASDKKELKSIVVFVLTYFCLWQQRVYYSNESPIRRSRVFHEEKIDDNKRGIASHKDFWC